jgi:hypothetical protein
MSSRSTPRTAARSERRSSPRLMAPSTGDVGDDAPVGLVLVEDAEADDETLVGADADNHPAVHSDAAAGWDTTVGGVDAAFSAPMFRTGGQPARRV